jgi:glutamate/tyrosine decarboxylase-like PLP-dependent enzyme
MHTWIQKAADLSGLGTASIRWIETDAELRMDVAALARQVDADRTAGYIPFLVVGTAGSVATGAVDALDEIGTFCKAQNLWFHVDGAYGGFAAATPEAPAELKALASADSVAVDPHKWLYAPLEAGCALVRDTEALRAAFAYHSPYYHFGEQVENFVDFGFQNSRGFRALKVWLGLSHVGAAAYRQMIADDIALARRLADVVRRTQELELFTQSLSITTFRFVPADLRAAAEEPANVKYLNDLNTKVLDHLQRHGEAFVSNAVVDGRYVLRACVVNFHTDAGDIDALPEIVVRAGRELHAARSQEHR